MAMKKLRPAEEAESGRATYAEIAPDVDVSHSATMWHLLSLGHLVATDLDRIARRHGLSMADLMLLGGLRVRHPQSLRATDLAHMLRVSNAVLTTRVARLERAGLLHREPDPSDRRAFGLTVSADGVATVDAAIADISRDGQVARWHRRLAAEDRAAVARILGDLHDLMDRDFVAAPR
ncbi:MarR family transcriptional regulator [Phenylobacterium sp. LjRoot219]|uniref:MarR family winged helix-turn-helix transcriptional regulator n=1 Tax=Phenylobacterium sp. LjRoot219 TaxID=3342283 RepID=UPI003ECF948A